MARHPLMSIRRIGTAVALAALLGAGGIVMGGTAATETPTFSLPARHAGDRVTYASSWDTDGRARFGPIEQLPIFAWKDGDGVYQLVDGIREDRELGEAIVPGYSYLDLDHKPLAATSGRSMSSSSSGGLLGLTSESVQGQASHLVMGASSHPCGFVNSLQGASGGQLVAVCPAAGDRVFNLTGSAPWNGGQAAVFSAGNMTLWFQPDIPYPVRYEHGDLWFEMTGFTRGSEPLKPVPLPEDTPLPDVLPAPLGAYGPESSGLAMRYPMERAIEEAMTDPAFPDLREFMATHPDARVVAAEHIRESDQEIWVIEWSDEEEKLVLTVVHERIGAVSALHPASGLDPEAAWTTERRAWLRNDGGRTVLPPSAPRLQDVASAWQVYAGSTQAPRVVGFSFHSYSPVTVYAGDFGQVTTSFTGVGDVGRPPAETDTSSHTLHYRDDGHLVAIDITQRASTRGEPLPSPQAAADMDVLAEPGGWRAPSVQAAAGIGLGALLVGAVYWAWPLLQSVPVLGLRWRRRRALLDHPVRRRLHDAVIADPGIHYHQIVRETGLGKGAVEHHLRRLVEGKLLQCSRADGYTCYFPAATDHRATMAAGVLKSAGAQQVLEAVRSRPGASVAEIGTMTGLSPGTVSHHLRRLRSRGVIESWREGRTVRLRTGAVVALLP